MQSRRSPFPSNHRLARLTTWLVLWLARFVAVFEAIAPREAERLLVSAQHLARTLLVVRTLRRLPTRKPTRRKRGARNPMNLRIAAGGAWRRALRGRSMAERCAALQRVLADIETWITRTLRRFKRRFTRLFNRRYRTQDEMLRAAPLCVIACADTS
jgi:hypothetical protein